MAVPLPERVARVLIEQWRMHFNTVCPHSSLNYRGQELADAV